MASAFGVVGTARPAASGSSSGVPSFSTLQQGQRARVSSGTTTSARLTAAEIDRLPFLNLYDAGGIAAEASVYSMHDLERLMIRRMTILHTIQEQYEALHSKSLDIKELLGWTTDRQVTAVDADRRPEDADVNPLLQLTPSEDLVSHLLCRLVFCKDPKWTEWFVRTERFLFRAKLDLIWSRGAGGRTQLLEALLSRPWIQAEEVRVPVAHHPNFEEELRRTADEAAAPSNSARLKTINMTSNNSNNANAAAADDAIEYDQETKELHGKVLKWLYGCAGKNDANFNNLTEHCRERRVHRFFSVPFTVVKELVRRRSVFVHRGRAWVQEPHFVDFIAATFADRIRVATLRERPRRQALLDAAELSNGSDASSGSGGGSADAASSPLARLITLMDNIFSRYVADPVCEIKIAEEGTLTMDLIKPHAEMHMPPCMQAMNDTLHREGHLKHHGRWQYGLFLKTIGLSLQDSMRFFATTMTLKGGSNPEAFSKSAYGYSIRHMYGKEGKHTDYSSLSCASMISSPTPSGMDKIDCHGCPFRTLDEGGVRRMLAGKQRRISLQQPVTKTQQQQNRDENAAERGFAVGGLAPLPVGDIESIVEDTKGHHYTRACRRYFSTVHAGHQGDGQLFRSPAEYYRASVQLYRKAAEEAQKAAAGTAAAAASSSGGSAGESPGDRRASDAPALPMRHGEPTRTPFNAGVRREAPDE